MNYKLNKYLYFSFKENAVIIFNLFNGKIFAITKEKYDLLMNSNEWENLKSNNPHFFSAMEKLEVIVPYDLDELSVIKEQNRKRVFNANSYLLTINPTLECNFCCWYCYEKHPKGRMSQKTIDSVVKHVKHKIENEALKHLQLDWFGGEPLLYFNEVVYPLSLSLKQLSLENNVCFSNEAVTNAYLMNNKMIEKFQEIDLFSFQITLDGDEKTHNKIRFDKKEKDSYRKIIDNINLLSEYPNTKIALRINYTQDTLTNINNIINHLSNNAKQCITILFQQVWQDAQSSYVSSEENKSFFREKGFNVPENILNLQSYVCYADLLQQAVINYDGKVFKCTARDFSTHKADGVLQSNGEIEWDKSIICKRLGNATFENEFCISCELLPACMGPCSQKMIEYDKSYNFEHICLKGGFKHSIEQRIDRFYNNLQIN